MTMIDIGHEPPLDPPEPEVVQICEICGGEIYEGNSAYLIPSYGWICECCMNGCYEVAE